MTTVTNRIKQIKQPRGGYISPKLFELIELKSNMTLSNEENIHSSLVGMVVDYMTRFLLGSPLSDAFRISLRGAEIIGEVKLARKLISGVKGVDNQSIINACKLVGFDVCYRSGVNGYRPVSDINPNIETITNIQEMINRSKHFFENYGPIVRDNFTFEGGYTSVITSGDGDYLTKDSLFDFKVSKNAPTNIHTLQLLVYYLMGKHSLEKGLFDVKYIGIFNPRLNIIYRLELASIDENIIAGVSQDVIGYY